MCKMFGVLLVLVLIFAELAASHPSIEGDDVCAKLSKNSGNFDCVVTTKCNNHGELIGNGKAVPCGSDVYSGAAKICCPKHSQRIVRQARAQTRRDPFSIASQKCSEYSSARYVNRTIISPIPNEPDLIQRRLDCVLAEPLVNGGNEAKLKEFPHMARIGYSDRPENPVNDSQWICGGSLISDRYVLTAAHCIRSGEFVATWVRLGELVFDDDRDFAVPKDFRIAQRIPHPQYNSSSVYFDIMLLKLQDRVIFTPHMRPICLYTSEILSPSLNNKALITGWGATGTGMQQSESLLKAKVDFIDDNKCTESYKGDKKLLNGFDPVSMVCAIGDKYGNDTCEGDSGGPLQVPIPMFGCMYWEVGITSYGSFFCGQKDVPTIYTKVWHYIPWIQSIVWP